MTTEMSDAKVCDHCNGRGVKDLERCPYCDGKGKVKPFQLRFKEAIYGNNE